MLSNCLTEEIKSYLKKIDNLHSEFEKYKDHESQCKKLKGGLNELEQKYEKYLQKIQNNLAETSLLLNSDFNALTLNVREFNDEYGKLIHKLDLKGFAFLVDTEKTKEIADQCWEVGYAMIQSDAKLRLAFIVEESKLKQEVGINQEEYRKDRQLMAEEILQKLGKIKEGRKNKQIRADLELVGKLINSSQLFKRAKEEYCKLEKIFNQSGEILNAIQDQVDQLNSNFSALSNEIKKVKLSEDIIEPIIQDPKRTKEIREKILGEKTKRKETERLEVKREVIKERKTPMERQEEKNIKQIEKLSKLPLQRGQAGVYKDKDILEIYQNASPVACEAKLIVEHLKELLKLKEENFRKERENLPKEESLVRLNDIIPKKKRLTELEKAVDSKIAYMDSVTVEYNIQDRSNKYYLEAKVKRYTQDKKKEISNISEDELYKKIENNLSLLQNYKEKLENWISEEEKKKVASFIQKSDKMVGELERLHEGLEKIRELREAGEKLQQSLSVIQNSKSTTPSSNFSELDEICKAFRNLSNEAGLSVERITH